MLRVVIIDDDPTIIDGLSFIINNKLPDITITKTYVQPEVALDNLPTIPFDLLITDIEMGNLNGLDLIDQLKQQCSFDFSSIIISAYQEFTYAQKSIELDVKSYLTKPIDFNKLITLLKNELTHFKSNPEINGQRNDYSDITQQLVYYIQDNYQGTCHLKLIAPELHYNTAYLGRLFQKETGVTFNDFLLNYRIAHAKDFLKDSSLSIDDVSERVGFLQTNYFSKKFKKLTGLTPNQYRKNI